MLLLYNDMEWDIFLEDKSTNMVEFFTKRKAGAAKIASEARAKGGVAMLTYWHFAAKDTPYTEVLAAIKAEKPESFYSGKMSSLLSKSLKKGQQEVQELLGRIEVWAEARAQLFGKE